MKRFWTSAAAVPEAEGWGVRLDERPLRTPARALLVVPTQPLAQAIAGEWSEASDNVDPRAMPLTGLANAAIDRVAPDPEAFARTLAHYGESDLLCYRSEAPAALAARQAAAWDPILAWARRRFDVNFTVTAGVIHRPQPPDTIVQLAQAVAARDPFELAALSPLVTISGSLVIALALAEEAIGLETAWAAATLDEAWQAEQWGEDSEATARLEARRAEFEAAERFLRLLR